MTRHLIAALALAGAALAAAGCGPVPVTGTATAARAVPASHATCKPHGHRPCPSPSPTATSPAPTPTSTSPSPAPTQTTPSPSPTVTSPSPTPTGTSPSPTPTGTACVTSNQSGGCPASGAYYDPADITNSNGWNTYVNQNVFGTVTSQTLTAYSPGNWSVTADSAAGDTSVESYPDAQQLYTLSTNQPDPLSGFASLAGTETETMPHNPGTIAEAAWDLWTDYTSDVMVWTDNVGRCNAGAQGKLLAASQSVGGQVYDVYQYGGPGQEVIFSLQGPGGTGTCAQDPSSHVDILAILAWVNAHVAPVTGLGQVQFGWELCSTGGTPETFSVSSLTIKDTCVGGGTGCQS